MNATPPKLKQSDRSAIEVAKPRLIIAAIITTLVLAAIIPSLGRIAMRGGSLVVVHGWQDALWIGIVLAPLALIVVGILKSIILEVLGWTMLIALLVLVFAS